MAVMIGSNTPHSAKRIDAASSSKVVRLVDVRIALEDGRVAALELMPENALTSSSRYAAAALRDIAPIQTLGDNTPAPKILILPPNFAPVDGLKRVLASIAAAAQKRSPHPPCLAGKITITPTSAVALINLRNLFNIHNVDLYRRESDVNIYRRAVTRAAERILNNEIDGEEATVLRHQLANAAGVLDDLDSQVQYQQDKFNRKALLEWKDLRQPRAKDRKAERRKGSKRGRKDVTSPYVIDEKTATAMMGAKYS
ncbi:hypothetical protein H2203_003852 [Taxawa tesnikishii (nom. ined.)]|nr:hypothetical protein H2203_003852 [Dothideales sp. JES 119]